MVEPATSALELRRLERVRAEQAVTATGNRVRVRRG
jgi:hypothetical protein